MSRRGFLGTLGAGAVGAAALGGAAEAASSGVVAAGDSVTISLKVNGTVRSLAVEPRATLLEVLRGPLGKPP